MSRDQEHGDAPPDFGVDNDDSKNDDLMFVSAISPGTVDISLSGGDDDDEEENPFGGPPPTTRQITSTNTVESTKNSAVNAADEKDDIFGGVKKYSDAPPLFVPAQVPIAVPEPQPPTPTREQGQLYPTDLNIGSPYSPQTSTPTRQQGQFYPTDFNSGSPYSSPPSAFESAFSPSTPISTSNYSEQVTASKPVKKRSSEDTIEITVSDPTKVGDGMSSYMTYRVTTKTTLAIFKQPEFSVNRRFSDFLGLQAKLVQKHLHLGIIVPAPPEKDAISMAKVKISKDESKPTDFIDHRRALLERFLNRIAQNDKLIEDLDVREFLELPNELPKSKDTQALSGAGVLRVISNISHSVTKLTAKTNEQDQWFEEKLASIIEFQTHLKHSYNQFNTLFSQRKEAGHSLKQFSISLDHLATTEEHTSLSSALSKLANLEEKVDQINNEYLLKEYSTLTELIKEYISLLDMVHLAFNERIKLHQTWLSTEETLKKKRDTKTKLEQSPKGLDKLPQAEMEIRDWELKSEQSKNDFERISTTIKEEIETFEQTRIDDFKKGIDKYLKNILEQQEKILQLWENYLPEANQITV